MSHETLLLRVLLELVVIIVAARAGGWLCKRLGQPQVVGEIAAGLLLGPSALGRLAPDLSRELFSAEAEPILRLLGQLGLVLLMFLIGLEFDFGHLRRLGGTAVSVSLAGILLPFASGLAVASLIQPLVAPNVRPVGFTLFLATALSITAIPILGRILIEFGIVRTRVGALAITAAAVDDALGWILLAAVGAVVAGSFRWIDALSTLGLLLGFVAGIWLVVRPVVAHWCRGAFADLGRGLGLVPFSLLLAGVLASAALTERIGVFSVLGPFVLGAALWDQDALRTAVGSRLWDVVNALFLPVFFTYTGLRTDVGTLDSLRDWLICGLILAAAVIGKLVGTALAARLGGLGWRESACVGVLMNTRALMGLVAIHVGRELGLVPPEVFTMLVLMALVTTFMTSPLLRLLLREPPRPVG